MMTSHNLLRILLLADIHLGFDLPLRPRIQRRRRGPDFFANFERALAPALRGEVDLVVHGGDLFYRSKVPASLVDLAMTPLVLVAARGTPVYLVPGNHERSRIPLHLWAAHPNLHIFDRPRTFLYSGAKGSIALSGFPFASKVRHRFAELVNQACHEKAVVDHHLLCMHQTVEGAQVGASNYIFRSGPDVISGRDIPTEFSAVLCGHIHRAQTLTHDLNGQPLPAPVIYPGSIERTSFAERTEHKGYVILTIDPAGRTIASIQDTFVPLPVRPMVSLLLEPAGSDIETLRRQLATELQALHPDSVVRLRLGGPKAGQAREVLSASYLREIAPPTMNIDLATDPAQFRLGS